MVNACDEKKWCGSWGLREREGRCSIIIGGGGWFKFEMFIKELVEKGVLENFPELLFFSLAKIVSSLEEFPLVVFHYL